MAKLKINHLFETQPIFKIKPKEEQITINEEDDKYVIEIINEKFFFYIQSNKLASKFKAIVKESKVEYKDILNYTLSVLNNKIEKILTKFDKYFKDYAEQEAELKLSKSEIIRKAKLEDRFSNFVIGYIDFVFFLYTVSPKVNTTIKLCHIMSKIMTYYKGEYKLGKGDKVKTVSRFVENSRDAIFKKMVDDISLVLSKHQITKHTQIEHLYLFILLKDLGKNYRLEPIVLEKYFQLLEFKGTLIPLKHLNYFCITTLLFYISDIKIYEGLKDSIKQYILASLNDIDPAKRRTNCEHVLLFLDLIVCPYLDVNFKNDLLAIFNVESSHWPAIIEFKSNQKYWFTKWENFNLAKELNSKISEEVYS